MTRPIRITDLDDTRVEAYRDVRDRDLRGRDRLFMAESELILRRLLRRPERVESVLLSPGKHERLASDLERLPEAVPVYVADLGLISAIAGFHVHRGVLAAGRRPSVEETSLDGALGHLRGDGPLTLLVVEGITNVDNLGAIFRNAAAFGGDGIVLDPTCCDPLYRKAVRVSMGHVLSVPWAASTAWPADLDRLRAEWGVTVVAAECAPGAVPLWEVPRRDRLAIVLGGEGAGLSRDALALCDVVAEIPMAPGVPSLNVGVATAVFLYERLVRRSATGESPEA